MNLEMRYKNISLTRFLELLDQVSPEGVLDGLTDYLQKKLA